MKEIILIKNGELALKGLNRSVFEDTLVKNLKVALKSCGEHNIRKAQSTIYIEPSDESFDFDEALDRVSKVFGIAAFSRARVCDKDMDSILAAAPEYLEETMGSVKTFKVEAKRADKRFPFKSPEISASVGAALLSKFHHLRVDVHNPDVVVTVEIRDQAYIRGNQLKGAGGMPVSTSGKGALMLSGGIDSPVAAYMMAKRGMSIMSVHFASPPYTSDRARHKVITLAEKLTDYTGDMNLFIVPFTEVQEYIRDNGVAELFTILMRRSMMRITEKLSRKFGASAIITGESLGQVASQTMAAITATNASVDMPIFRPVIGMDKTEITEIARKIDTFETSILPYEDCCTIFTPPHPKTKPSLEEVINAETAMGLEKLFELEQLAADEAEKLRINVQ